MQMKVYLDNGASTMADKRAVKAMLPCFTKIYGNPSSLHTFGADARKAVDSSREVIAKKINADINEIIFTSGGTESDNTAIIGAAKANNDKGDHIITTKIEHKAVLNAFKYLEKKGFKTTYLNVDKEGLIDLDELKKAIIDKTILVSVMHANNEIGTIQNIRGIGKICREKNVILHTDTVQSFTKVPINVKDDFIDLASFSSHKIHGPKGVGALFIRSGVKIKPLLHGGGHEFNLRAGTENVPGIVGFAKAAELCNSEANEKMKKLRDYMIEKIKKIPNAKINGSLEKRLVNNINVSFKGIEGEAILTLLNEAGVAVSTGSACHSKNLQPSHVLKSIKTPDNYIQGSIRITVSRFTTKKEADYAVKNLKIIVKKLTEMSPLG
ncbi:cysteine desulfurase NifS [archaeon CG_4_10_14_0_2_um_filter_Archaea_38_6]|nr:MAG: cysteine desulfurase NifS [archaeon CG07_land_8_20_14_0_80_38_8]PIU89216.1 MAG: cysteine desulfurase NifS [archaeon CG06_land_8_20_14_3_00_37_11]PJA21841.1 MAG: cysteine desulfurase NifS [archaeon CG_4_10_14_0_2_um_filter_Archaea_38_6]